VDFQCIVDKFSNFVRLDPFNKSEKYKRSVKASTPCCQISDITLPCQNLFSMGTIATTPNVRVQPFAIMTVWAKKHGKALFPFCLLRNKKVKGN
tara:strand:+ start:705 stop:986 length:282 start_codon:yes stop_codon:yes gene_type:complete